MFPFTANLHLLVIVFASFASHVTAYFIVTSPTSSTVWKNGAANKVTWTKGVLDGIDLFDIEMTRMSQEGLSLIARAVPKEVNSLNIFIDDVPPGNDYYLIFINSTHGVMHTTSQKFTILASSASGSASSDASPKQDSPTITLSGSPNPTKLNFATTMGPTNAASSLSAPPSRRASSTSAMIAVSLIAAAFGVLCTVWW